MKEHTDYTKDHRYRSHKVKNTDYWTKYTIIIRDIHKIQLSNIDFKYNWINYKWRIEIYKFREMIDSISKKLDGWNSKKEKILEKKIILFKKFRRDRKINLNMLKD